MILEGNGEEIYLMISLGGVFCHMQSIATALLVT